MESFDLDTKLLEFGTENDLSKSWCIKHSILGLQCWGSNGSGKSSSMKTFALKYLRADYGFLILSVKSERDTWEEYCELAGRKDDLIIIGPSSNHRFDFMQYLSSKNADGGFTMNLLNILKAVIRSSDQKTTGKTDDPFWEKSLDLLLYNAISLCQLAYGSVSVQGLYDLVQSAPKGKDEDSGTVPEDDPNSAFSKAFESIRKSLAEDFQKWKATWTEGDKMIFEDREYCANYFTQKFPKARDFKFVEQFFKETFKSLAERTRSIIQLSVSNFLFHLLQEPIYTLFCSEKTTVTPEDSLDGKIILLDLPTKKYFDAGRSSQLLFKYIWQLSVERRDTTKNPRAVCLWSDESPVFLMEHDALFTATARSSKIAVCYIAQNIHQYYSAMGGEKSKDLVASFLATMNTTLYFSNNCTTTNQRASQIVGDETYIEPSRSITYAEKFSDQRSMSLKEHKLLKPEAFSRLKTGGLPDCVVEAYIHVQGDPLFNGRNFKKIRFNQNYK